VGAWGMYMVCIPAETVLCLTGGHLMDIFFTGELLPGLINST